MKALLKNLMLRLVGTRDSSFNRRLSVFLVCTVLSAFLWGMLRLSKEYEETINLPLTFRITPGKQSLLSVSDSVITIKAGLKGLRILSMRHFETEKAYELDLRNLKLKAKGDGTYYGYLPVELASSALSDHLSIKTVGEIVNPDTLFFIFEKTVGRKVAVIPRIEYHLKDQHMLTDSIKCIPDSVIVKGASRRVDTLRGIFTSKISAGEISGDIQFTAPLKYPGNIPLELSHQVVSVHLKAEAYTEASVEVPVELPDTALCRIRVFPDKEIGRAHV